MRLLSLCLLLLVCMQSFAQQAKFLDLPIAHEQKKVEIKAVSAGGLHPEENLKCRIKNLGSAELNLRIPPGLHFKSEDPGAQDLFTVREVLLVMAPFSEEEIGLKGYCMQASNYSPATEGVYHFSGYAAFPLKTLGDSLYKYQPLDKFYGQMFVWAITDRHSMYNITVDSALFLGAKNVMEYVAQTTGQSRVSVQLGEPGSTASFTPSVEVFSRKAIMAFHNPVTQRASFKLYDESGNELLVFFEDRQLNNGIKHYTFGVNDIINTGDEPVYYARVLNREGKILSEMKIDKDTEEVDVVPFTLNFPFEFELKQPAQFVKLNFYLEDGTLLEEFYRYRRMDAGRYNINVEFMHLHPAGTKFIARLEDVKGKVYHEQMVK